MCLVQGVESMTKKKQNNGNQTKTGIIVTEITAKSPRKRLPYEEQGDGSSASLWEKGHENRPPASKKRGIFYEIERLGSEFKDTFIW